MGGIVLTLEAARQYSPGMYDGLPFIDADAHKMENPVVFFDYLDPAFRDRLGSRIDRYGQQRLVIRDFNPATGERDLERIFPQPDGPGKGAFAAIHPETAIGGIFNRIRVEHMDREGVEAQVLYGSMTLSFEAIIDRELAVACMRAYNTYMADDCRAYGRRLLPVGFVSLVDVDEAVREMRRCVEELGMVGIHVPPSLPVPHPAARGCSPQSGCRSTSRIPTSRRSSRKRERLDVALGVHGSPGVYLPGGISEQVDTFILSHLRAPEPDADGARDVRVRRRLRSPSARLRMGFLESGLRLGAGSRTRLPRALGETHPATSIPTCAFPWAASRPSSCASAAARKGS
jgi:hypothetical protein